MRIKELILKKRNGGEHSPEELKELLHSYLDGEVKDYHMAAWLMAVFFRGMNVKEMREWTRLMWQTGRTFPRSREANEYWVDKHSTGGVGDKTSIILVPLVSSVCRRLFGETKVNIPMVSGRGLGHTGGTLDKLESVPGFSADVSFEQASDLLEKNGFLIMGQTKDMVPSDRLLYSLRDVTSTVDSLPLIVSSIMSKKLSENLDGIVFDIKSGHGAFMKTEQESRKLTEALIDVAKANGVNAVGVLSRMDEPLGFCVGNQLEIEEGADFLEGHTRESGLLEVVRALASWMVYLAGQGKISIDDAKSECEKELATPQPFELFKTLIGAQGGRWSSFESARESLPEELEHLRWAAKKGGWIHEIKADRVGNLVNFLGGGRDDKDAKVDMQVGMRFEKKVGDYLHAGDAVVDIYFRDKGKASEIEKMMDEAIVINDEFVKRKALVLGTCYEE